MAENVFVWIKAQRAGEVKGDSTVSSLGREGSIEAFKLEYSLQIERSDFGSTAGKRFHSPVTFTKRVDRSSPVLHQILCEDDPVDVTIKFYRPNPIGDGTTEHFYTLRLKNGRITSIKTISPNTLDQSSISLPVMEEVSIAFGEITYKYSSGATVTEHTDEWST